MKLLDFLAIGDITIDSFIRLQDVSVHCELNHERCQLCVNFGDKIPFEFVETVPAVGNSPNAAVSAARLGLRAAVVSDIGKDRSGEDCLEQLKLEKVSTGFISSHENLPTNQHYVLWYKDERTILVKHTAYPYKLPELPKASWVYLSSIGNDSFPYHALISDFLAKNPESKFAFQPGTFQIKMGIEKMAPFYKRATLLAVNVGEAQKIIGASLTVPDLLRELKNLGPELVLITDGRKGSYLHDGVGLFRLPIYPDAKDPYERTGAGDSTTSTLVSFMHLGLSPIEALKRGHINARSVVQQIGAQKGLLTREEIEETLRNAPSQFKPEKIA